MTEADTDRDKPVPPAPSAPRHPSSRKSAFFRSPAAKLFGLMFIGAMLMVPLAMVWALVSERDFRSQSVVREIGRQWGPWQNLTGPFAVVPYTVEIVGTKTVEVVAGSDTNPVVVNREEPDIRQETRYAVFSPETLVVDGSVETSVRKRSIYSATVYSSDLALSGRFFPSVDIASEQKITSIDWSKMQIVLGVSGLPGIEHSDLVLDGNKVRLEPGSGFLTTLNEGAIHAPDLRMGADKAVAGFDFHLNMRLRGSSGFTVAPAGRSTDVTLRSPWPHPGFHGRFLPKQRDISNDGFSANWQIPHFARPLPVQWTLPENHVNGLRSFSFGVKFVTPVDFYSLIDRALKYGVMFIGVVFVIVFALEIATGRRIHGVQYLLVGLMMVMFFLLLLAFAEHTGFAVAYLIASTATGLVLTTYVGLVFAGLSRALMAASSFICLYGVLYLILQMEDFALVAGAVLGFFILTGILFGTRKLDWSGLKATAAAATPPDPVPAS